YKGLQNAMLLHSMGLPSGGIMQRKEVLHWEAENEEFDAIVIGDDPMLLLLVLFLPIKPFILMDLERI
ncbi:MAG: hypothetical protein M1816_004171, partial [Peltula sp. TS41687]